MSTTDKLKVECKLHSKNNLFFDNPKIIRSYMLVWYFGDL